MIEIDRVVFESINVYSLYQRMLILFNIYMYLLILAFSFLRRFENVVNIHVLQTTGNQK